MATDADNVNRELRNQWLTDFEDRTAQLVLDLVEDRPLEEKTIQKWIKDYLFLRSVEEEMNTESADPNELKKRQGIRNAVDSQTTTLTAELFANGHKSPKIQKYLRSELSTVRNLGLYAEQKITPQVLKQKSITAGNRLTSTDSYFVILDAITKEPWTLKLRKKLQQLASRV
ncbi:hypothetical protein KBD71_03365 [Candidatus Woesebacteria bacterium]|nr:hypothetical protein [Candidatus Woesebacteria bacterium]